MRYDAPPEVKLGVRFCVTIRLRCKAFRQKVRHNAKQFRKISVKQTTKNDAEYQTNENRLTEDKVRWL